MKILLVVCDGISDRPSGKSLQTPLLAAKKPTFNYFAKTAICGQMDVIDTGTRPGSDTAHLALLGYNPYEVYSGRGPFEAAGLKMDVQPGDIAFRANFATVDKNLVVIDRRAGRLKYGGDELAECLNGIEIDGVKFYVAHGVEHRAAIIMRGKNLSPDISDVDPHKKSEKICISKPLFKNDKNAEFTAEVLNKFVNHSYKILSTHKINFELQKANKKVANILLPRGAGKTLDIPKIEKLYGLKSACIAGIPLIKGICKLTGMEIIDVKGATGDTNTDMIAKASAALDCIQKYDFVLLNIKAPDIYGHDNDFNGKVKCVEQIDAMLNHIRKNIDTNVIVALTSDHSTPVTVGEHTADPVPVAIKGMGVRVDSVKTFDEFSTANGALGRIRGSRLIHILLDLANRSEKFGS